ncbi:alpha/beta hydrolase [Gordonia neofelifaecis]|uniref:DUF1023 domain-containing protein n=1 Tax=Gordonia neofelifaecis NRRL B-59395 TaxID=644548 RepID=F1YKT6_9ACTN|nr:alpha/beta hydrolase [Gordonia neofelifaecis]EGD54730.1 hypothetical protein SCNU_12607 [Gordonia neofelifaecis NRRL B-59395]
MRGRTRRPAAIGMTGVAEVLGWPLDEMLAAATRFDTGGERVANTSDSIRRSSDLDPTWRGVTRQAADKRVDAETTALHRLERTLLDIARTTRDGHARLAAIRDRIASQLAAAQTSGFDVGDDGAVTHPDPSRRADAAYLTDRITGLLDEADAADVSLGTSLDALVRQLDGSGSLVPLPNGEYVDAADATFLLKLLPPEMIARYWASLNDAQRRDLIEAAPDVIGNLNGIDFADRAAANTRSIRDALTVEIQAGRGGGEKAGRLRELLAPADDPRHPGRKAPRSILGFRDEGNGHFIEMVGDLGPDATGVAVLVPGTGTGLHSVDDYRRRAVGLSRASGAPVIVYADGDLPQELIDTDLTPFENTAFDPGAAHRLAPRLVDFTGALDQQLAVSGLTLKTTLIGHSYGGSVVGTAEQLGIRADRIVYASSAGTGVESGPWKNANPEVQRYSLTPPGDPIHYAQVLGAPVHGGDPDTAPGVTRLDTGRYADGTVVEGRHAHSGYLDDPASGALRNIAAVVAGREVTPYVDRGPDIDARGQAEAIVDGLLDETLNLVSLVLPGR